MTNAVCWLLCGPLRALGQMSAISMLSSPSQSDSQASSRSISGRHLLCSQMFPILSPSASQGGLLLLILVQIGMNFSGWKHSKRRCDSPCSFFLCVLKYTVLTEELMPQEKGTIVIERQFPEKKAHGGWWGVGRGSHTGSTRERKELWVRPLYGGFCRKSVQGWEGSLQVG